MSLGELACLAGDKWSGVVHQRRSLYIALNKAADWGQEQLKRGILDYLNRRRQDIIFIMGFLHIRPTRPKVVAEDCAQVSKKSGKYPCYFEEDSLI